MIVVDEFMWLKCLAKCKCRIGSMCILSLVLVESPRQQYLLFLSHGAFSGLKKTMDHCL